MTLGCIIAMLHFISSTVLLVIAISCDDITMIIAQLVTRSRQVLSTT